VEKYSVPGADFTKEARVSLRVTAVGAQTDKRVFIDSHDFLKIPIYLLPQEFKH
jgi:hypothetical protein